MNIASVYTTMKLMAIVAIVANRKNMAPVLSMETFVRRIGLSSPSLTARVRAKSAKKWGSNPALPPYLYIRSGGFPV